MKKTTLIYLSYLVALTLVSLLGSYTALPYLTLGVFFMTAIVVVYLKKDILYLLPLLAMAPFHITGNREFQLPLTIYYLAILPVIGTDFVLNRRFRRYGALSVPILLLVLAAAISMLNSPYFFIGLNGFLILFGTYAAYLYLINTLEAKEDLLEKTAYFFAALSVIVFVQLGLLAYQSPLPIYETIRMRDMNFAWIANTEVIYMNLLAMPLAGYLLVKKRFHLPFFGLLAMNLAATVAVFSRPAIMSALVILAATMAYAFLKSRRKPFFIGELTVFLIIVLGALYVVDMEYGLIRNLARDLLRTNLTDIRLLIRPIWFAYYIILDNPLIGTGGIVSTEALQRLNDAGHDHYANVFLQTLTMGVIGLAAFCYLLFHKVRLFLKAGSAIRFFAFLLLLVTLFVQGVFEPMYYHHLFILGFFLLIAAIEVDTRAKQRAF